MSHPSGAAGRPDFVVSQFHGDNIAMSWFLVVATGIPAPGTSTPSTFKLIVYGTGKEVLLPETGGISLPNSCFCLPFPILPFPLAPSTT